MECPGDLLALDLLRLITDIRSTSHRIRSTVRTPSLFYSVAAHAVVNRVSVPAVDELIKKKVRLVLCLASIRCVFSPRLLASQHLVRISSLRHLRLSHALLLLSLSQQLKHEYASHQIGQASEDLRI